MTSDFVAHRRRRTGVSKVSSSIVSPIRPRALRTVMIREIGLGEAGGDLHRLARLFVPAAFDVPLEHRDVRYCRQPQIAAGCAVCYRRASFAGLAAACGLPRTFGRRPPLRPPRGGGPDGAPIRFKRRRGRRKPAGRGFALKEAEAGRSRRTRRRGSDACSIRQRCLAL